MPPATDRAPPRVELLTDPNLAYLDAALRRVRLRLEVVGGVTSPDQIAGELERLDEVASALVDQAATARTVLRLLRLAAIFRLDPFERDVLVLAAAPDLDAQLADLVAGAQASGACWPTAGLAWRLFTRGTGDYVASRDCFRADAPLFRFQLVHALNEGQPLPDLELRIDRRIADELVGRTLPDARVVPFLRAARLTEPAVAEPGDLVERVARAAAEQLGRTGSGAARLVVHLHGAPPADLAALAGGAAARLGLPVLAVSAAELPLPLALPFVRESLLQPCALLLSDLDFAGAAPSAAGAEWARILGDSGPLVFVAGARLEEQPEQLDAAWLSVAVPRPARARRAGAWRDALCDAGPAAAAAADALADSFELTESEIRATAAAARAAAALSGEPLDRDALVGVCRAEAKHRMSELAQLLIPAYGWDDLLLPPDAIAKLRELVGQAGAGAQTRVLEEYGFGARLPRGRGVTALFAGQSGTGKTMAAEVIARELERELYRVDLARVVSKYVGETEKNLRQIFAEAERARCVLLFDEAESLYSRRISDVRDSHDRFANIEVSYLLQLLEDSRWAVILLATNRREAIDEAFLRRFRFVVDFPLPGVDLRRELWRRSFPSQVDVGGVRFDVLAERLPLTGASIKNIALAATFLAATDGGRVTAQHVGHAARRELEKLARPAPFDDKELLA